MTVTLDALNDLARLDPDRMIDAVLAFPEMAEKAREIALHADLGLPGSYRNIVVSGLGGSAIGGDLNRALFAGSLREPMIVNREYDVPEFVDEATLFIASSYSGNTEETLAAFADALERGAHVVAVTTGGKLKNLARENDCPCVLVPGGYQPRAALGYGMFALMYALVRLGVLLDPGPAFDEMLIVTHSIRERCHPDVPSDKNPAKHLAARIAGHLPVVYGSEGYRGVVATRWKGQFNENAKTFAAAGVFPEMNHNETVGWSGVGDLGTKLFTILLRDPRESTSIARRVELTKQILAKHSGGIAEVWSEGSSDLAKMCSLIYMGDFVSLYLAYLRNVDPTPVPVIDWLKSELAK